TLRRMGDPAPTDPAGEVRGMSIHTKGGCAQGTTPSLLREASARRKDDSFTRRKIRTPVILGLTTALR
ncbi:MAG: hypothetical protein AB2404_14685, partial [Planifilum fimeticola]